MPTFLERATTLFGVLQSSAAKPTHFAFIPVDHTDSPETTGPLVADQQYFEIRINELYLPKAREWGTTYDPMAVAIVTYRYRGEPKTVPLVVGPSMIEGFGNKLPQGMVFANTRVVGPQPYRGDGISLSVVLYQLKRDDMLRRMLKVLENTSQTLGVDAVTSTYTKIADTVLSGIEEIAGTSGAAMPVLGRREDFQPVECGFYVLIDGAVPVPAKNQLWVRAKQLVTGPSLADAVPYREADYVLFSVTRVPREDVSGLSFYPTYQLVMDEALRATRKDVWNSAKVKMSTLYSLLHNSADLTRPHSDALAEEWKAEMLALRERAIGLSRLGPVAESSDTAAERDRAMEILDL